MYAQNEGAAQAAWTEGSLVSAKRTPINDGLPLFERLHALRKHADELNCHIELCDHDPEEGLDFGPFLLRDQHGYRVWEFGLPVAGIADALRCFARELAGDKRAWTNFGARWAARYMPHRDEVRS